MGLGLENARIQAYPMQLTFAGAILDPHPPPAHWVWLGFRDGQVLPLYPRFLLTAAMQAWLHATMQLAPTPPPLGVDTVILATSFHYG